MGSFEKSSVNWSNCTLLSKFEPPIQTCWIHPVWPIWKRIPSLIWVYTVCTDLSQNINNELSLVTRKPVFGVLSRRRTSKVLIRLRGYAGWYVPLLFAYCINRFSHDAAQLMGNCFIIVLNFLHLYFLLKIVLWNNDSNGYPQHMFLWRNKQNYPDHQIPFLSLPLEYGIVKLLFFLSEMNSKWSLRHTQETRLSCNSR